MGFFDTYVPDPALRCPACCGELRNWQGKDGPCLLLTWQQGSGEALATDPELDVRGVALPHEFLIYSYDCACFEGGVEAVGCCIDGVWRSTAYLTAEQVDRFYYSLPKAQRTARAEKLRKAGL
jgi:hypothetical protein